MEAERKGDWMQTFTGRRFYVLDPRPEDVDIEDIAHALSMVCRFAGHVRTFYSVGEHSVRVSHVAEQMAAERTRGFGASGLLEEGVRLVALAGLLHDAAEAYIGDMIRPLKTQPEMAPYKAAEMLIEDAIATRFGLPFTASRTVKIADNVLLATEARDIMGGEDQWRCLRGHTPLTEQIVPWSQAEAKARFLDRFRALDGR